MSRGLVKGGQAVHSKQPLDNGGGVRPHGAGDVDFGIISDMEKLATDIYTFEKLVRNGFTYVDKTDRLWPLVNLSIGSQFFIARPRRFGKSLTVSVLQALFEGRRELFRGLFIEPLWDWSREWPVLRLDLGSVQPDRAEELEGLFTNLLDSEARRNGVPLRRGASAPITFFNLIEDLAATSTSSATSRRQARRS